MTLNQFIERGGCMLSNWTSGCICNTLKCNEKQLRQKDLTIIFAVSQVAVREISTFLHSEGKTLRDYDR